MSAPAPGPRCQCRSGATVWQLQDPRAPAGAGAGLATFPGKPREPSCCWELTVPVSPVRARLGTLTSRKGQWELCNPEPCSDITPFLLFPSQFEMLTGALPFQGKDRKETMTLILK